MYMQMLKSITGSIAKTLSYFCQGSDRFKIIIMLTGPCNGSMPNTYGYTVWKAVSYQLPITDSDADSECD